jgi:hypothetical protein
MGGMRPTILASFQCLPALLCGLLCAAWAASGWWNPSGSWSLATKSEPMRALYASLQPATVQVVYSRSLVRFYDWIPVEPGHSQPLGFYQTHLVHDGDDGSIVQASYCLPIPMLLSLLLPIAAAPSPASVFPFGPTSPGQRSWRRKWRFICAD